MQDLILINSNEAIRILEKWFEDSYQETLILTELAAHPDVQYDFLKKFLRINETKIE